MDKVHTLWVGTLLFRLVDRNGSVSSLQVKIHVLAVSPLLILLFRRHVCLSGRQHILYKPQELSDNKLRLCLQRNWSSQDFRSILASGNQSSMTSTLNMWWSAKIRLATAEPIVLMHFIWHNFYMAIWTNISVLYWQGKSMEVLLLFCSWGDGRMTKIDIYWKLKGHI